VDLMSLNPSIARWCGAHKKNEGIMPSFSNARFNF
jgi:hypothetical protein